MFQTFSITPASSTDGNSPSPIPSSDQQPTKRKRKQVARACNLCRSSRTRCDDRIPCSSCITKGVKCSKDGTGNSKTLPSALREIEKLQGQVTQLQTPPNSGSSHGDVVNLPISSLLPTVVGGVTDGLYLWKGIQVQVNSTSRYFGPSSTYAFLGRSVTFLNSASEPTMEINQLVPKTRSERRTLPKPSVQSTQMSFSQEHSLLNLFWETFHSLTPILSEDDFRGHYIALWVGDKRQASPLVDVVLALCIQYGWKIFDDENTEDGASRLYLNSCRHQLEELWEHPSIEVIQSYVFMIIYLLNSAEFTNARNLLARAVEISHALGLHLKQNTPGNHQQDLGSRAWRRLFVLDVKLSIELGLPPCINVHDSQQNTSRMLEQPDFFAKGNTDRSVGDQLWAAEEYKLFEAARIAHTEFFSRALGTKQIYKDAKALESSAEFMTQCLKPIHAWFKLISGHPERTPQIHNPVSSVLDTSTRFGMQLQEIFLKLEYHQICMSFHRLFIHFFPHWIAMSPKSNSQATSALNHAVAITNILHQSLTTGITLNGFHPTYNFQWAAALTIMCFILAYPVCQPTPSARAGLLLAFEVLEMLGKDNPLALEAVAVLNRLNSSSKTLMATFNSTLESFRVESNPRTPPVVVEMLLETDASPSMFWSEETHYQHDMWTEFVNGLDTTQPFGEYDGDLGFLNAI